MNVWLDDGWHAYRLGCLENLMSRNLRPWKTSILNWSDMFIISYEKMRDQNLGLVPVTCCLPKHDCHTTSSVIHFTILKNNFWLLLPMFSTQFPPIAIYLVKLQKSSRKERVFFGKVGTEAECDAVTQSFDCASWRLKDTGRVETNRFYFVSVFD